MFDGGFYSERIACFAPFRSEPLTATWIDVLALARLNLELRSYSLDSVCKHYNLKRTKEIHSALEDACLCGQVYFALMDEIQMKRNQADDERFDANSKHGETA
jgi:DNA polymerase III alpha subunit (gram-positive type)